MTTHNFERTESHVAQSLQQHPDSTRAFSKELHNLERHEGAAAFKQDLQRLNDDLHKQGLLPGLQIVENEKTHQFELKKTDDANKGPGAAAEKAPQAPAASDAPAPASAPAQEQPHRTSGGGDHHAGHHRHHGRHHHKHGHHAGDDQGDDDNQNDNGDANKGNGANNPSDSSQPDKASKSGRTGSGVDGANVAPDGNNMTKDEKEKYLTQRLTAKDGLNLTDKQAAGVIGSLEGESPNLFTGRTDHKHEHDLGFVNWIGERRRSLESFAKEQGKDATDFKTQVAFMEKELQGSEHRALDKLRRTDSVSGATKAFTSAYERPGIPHLQKRIDNAEVAYEKVPRWHSSSLEPVENIA